MLNAVRWQLQWMIVIGTIRTGYAALRDFSRTAMKRLLKSVGASLIALVFLIGLADARTVKPVLHGQNWVAVTGKPVAATAGAKVFIAGGNAVDAACAMIAATSTMWDTLGWGGETQALIYNPHTGKVIGVNALGVAPTG